MLRFLYKATVLPKYLLRNMDVNRPWVDGQIVNTFRAIKKYTIKSWLRRLVYIWKNPRVVSQYLKLLTSKESVAGFSHYVTLDPSHLTLGHEVQTTHKHHRERVEKYKKGQKVSSITSGDDIIVCDWVVHDGNHRVSAAIEARVTELQVKWYYKLPDLTVQNYQYKV